MNLPDDFEEEEIMFDDINIPAPGQEDDITNEVGEVAMMPTIANQSKQDAVLPIPDGDRICFSWPGKAQRLVYKNNEWRYQPTTNEINQRSLIYKSHVGNGDTRKGLVIEGDYISALASLAPFIKSSAKMVYFDSPRKSTLTEECTPGYVDSTWLSIVRETALNASKSMSSDGTFILHTDEEMSHYGRIVLDEVFGRNNHVTTFAWQKKYAPQNDKTKNTPTDAFDYIIVYSKCSIEDLPKVGLLQTPDGIIDDGDWRGCYTAGHKGAKSGNERTKFHVNAPPYRWEIIDAHLPEGRHWFDAITGVLWYESIESTGLYWIKVKASDDSGNSDEKIISFSVRDPKDYNDHYALPKRIWWLSKDDDDIVKGGNLTISTDADEAIKGEPYSIIFKALGGTPYSMRSSAPGANRYWEFSKETLIEAIATTSASFGTKGAALPSIKTYHDRNDARVKSAVMNWLPWQEYGKAEDASRHVKALDSAGLTHGDIYLTAKPQKLYAHLINLFAPEDDNTIISLGDINAVMPSVALKLNRMFIHITGSSSTDISTWENVGKPRLSCVLDNKDSGDIEKDDEMPCEYMISPGMIEIFNVSNRIMTSDILTGAIKISDPGKECIKDFYAGLLGAYKVDPSHPFYTGIIGQLAYVLDSDEVLDLSSISSLSIKAGCKNVYIIAERTEQVDDNLIPANVTIIHAPFDLVGR